MSVINKMLRDLDQRQSAPQGTFGLSTGEPAPVMGQERSKTLRWPWLVSLLGLALLGGAYGAWQTGLLTHYLDAPSAPLVKVALETPVPTPPPAPEPVAAPEPVPVPVPEAAASAAPAVVVKNPVVVLRMDSQLSLRKLMETELAPPAVVAKSAPVPVPATKPRLVEAPVAPMAAPVTTSAAPQTAQRQQQAAKDAVAHAQSLWNAGSHEAAIELMQEVLAASERTLAGANNPTNLQALSLVVRELARMQLAESRPAPIFELLTRLEPVLGNQPDLWAIRANAAQRLGRHQDSVHAYMLALQSRPNEQRWLLGTAVSLAALGQTASSADMAEKARAVGVVSKEVLAYLRQMGVPVKD